MSNDFQLCKKMFVGQRQRRAAQVIDMQIGLGELHPRLLRGDDLGEERLL